MLNRKAEKPDYDTLSLSWKSNNVFHWSLFPYEIHNYDILNHAVSSGTELRWYGGYVNSIVNTITMRILALIITICFACSCSNEKKTSGSIDAKLTNELELKDSSEIATSKIATNTSYTLTETTPNASSVRTIDVKSTKVPELKNLSEIATDIQYIPLETQPKALLKFIYNITVSENRFYIKSFNELLCFDNTGKFIYKLAQLGRGPDQYTSITDYDINPGKKQVVVLSDNRRKYPQKSYKLKLDKKSNFKLVYEKDEIYRKPDHSSFERA